MSNTASPDLENYIKNHLLLQSDLGLECFDRLMNLCEYQFPMSPNLRMELSIRFGFDIIGIIEQYNDKSVVKLTQDIRTKIINIVPRNLQLEFIRLFDCPCCAEIIQTVTNIADAVDGTVVGQLTVERYEISGDYHIHLYYWNNSDWTIILDTSSLYQSADPAGFYDYQFNKFSNNWQYSLDQGQTWTDTEDYIFFFFF